MTLQQLRYFVEVAHTLHYTKAAQNLNISQPSLSYAISSYLKLGSQFREGLKVSY